MNLSLKRPSCFILVALFLVLSGQQGMAQTAQAPEGDANVAVQQFGGPNSVPGQLADDERLTESITGSTPVQGYFDWKDGLREKYGLSFSLDYTLGAVGATIPSALTTPLQAEPFDSSAHGILLGANQVIRVLSFGKLKIGINTPTCHPAPQLQKLVMQAQCIRFSATSGPDSPTSIGSRT